MTERRMRLLPLISLALTGLLVGRGEGTSESVNDATTVSGFAKNADGYADISVEELAGLLESEEVTLVNAPIPYEGELPETDLFIPYDEVADHLDRLPDKNAPVVLYGRSGSMSTAAAEELAALGYTNVLEVDGGFNAWKAAGYELLDEWDRLPVTRVTRADLARTSDLRRSNPGTGGDYETGTFRGAW